MKKYILLTLIISFTFGSMRAQTDVTKENKIDRINEDERLFNGQNIDIDYYIGASSVKGKNITYVVDNDRESYIPCIAIYNSNNSLDPNSSPKQNGSIVRKNQLPRYGVSETIVGKILSSTFPKERMTQFASCLDKMRVILYIDSKSGKVIDVYYEIVLNGGKGSFSSISPRELEELENQIKSNVFFSISEEDKGYSFLLSGFNFNFYHGLEILC